MITKRQRDLLNFIAKYMAKHDISPSYDEMKDALKLKSKSGIHRMLWGLKDRGFLEIMPHRARAVEVLRLAKFSDKGRYPVTEMTAGDLGL